MRYGKERKGKQWWNGLNIEELLMLTAENRLEIDRLSKERSINSSPQMHSQRISVLQEYNRRNWERIEQLKRKEEREDRKKEKMQTIKAAAAAYHKNSRSMAANVRSQLGKYKHCPYCFGPLGSDCEADHIIPVSYGGLSVESNMVYVCKACNQRKGDMTLREYCQKYMLNRQLIEDILVKMSKKI